MEEKIAQKCIDIFRSCILGCHREVAREFLNLALKKITPETKGYNLVEEEWNLLNERMTL
jgi:hypothetical protein